VPLSASDALRYLTAGPLHLQINDGMNAIWAGRIEQRNVRIDAEHGGFTFTAYGYWRALFDIPYTALWSDTRVSQWERGTEPDLVTRAPEKFEIDTNNRLYIAVAKGAAFPGTTTNAGTLVYKAPHQGSRTLLQFKFKYDFKAPPEFYARVVAYREGGSGNEPVILWTLTGNGSLLTGTKTLAIPADKKWVTIDIVCGTAGTTYNGEPADAYVRLTQIDVRTQAGTVTATDIAKDVLAWTRQSSPENARQLNASTAHIGSMTLDLPDVLYDDVYPGEILTRLTTSGDAQRTRWQVGVDANRYVYLRPESSRARRWLIDVADTLELEHALEALVNSVYPVFQDASGRTVRGPIATEDVSVRRNRITRRKAVEAQTTSETYAIQVADVDLANGASPPPASVIQIRELYDEHGAPWPLYALRPGDIVTIVNLSPSLSRLIDRVRTLRITEMEYSMATDTLQIVPEAVLRTTDIHRISRARVVRPKRYIYGKTPPARYQR
jgi:hypothetical protein